MARMKIVLRQPVPKLGEPGEVVSVAGGFARNYLIPRGLAVPATKGNLKQATDWQNSKSTRESRERRGAEQLREKLASRPLDVVVQAGPDGRLFGSITAADVAAAIAAAHGVEIDRHSIELPEPIRHLGVHEVRVRLHPEVGAELTVQVSGQGGD
jgi:large subunit ribosomal protein L9